MTLNPDQFARVPRVLNGETQHFAGWHVTTKKNFALKPKHEHLENVGGAYEGDVYATFEPRGWDYRGSHAVEVWSTNHRNAWDPEGMNSDENVVSHSDVRIGKQTSVEDAISASKPYDDYHQARRREFYEDLKKWHREQPPREQANPAPPAFGVPVKPRGADPVWRPR